MRAWQINMHVLKQKEYVNELEPISIQKLSEVTNCCTYMAFFLFFPFSFFFFFYSKITKIQKWCVWWIQIKVSISIFCVWLFSGWEHSSPPGLSEWSHPELQGSAARWIPTWQPKPCRFSPCFRDKHVSLPIFQKWM